VGPCFFPRYLACFSGLGMISLKTDAFLEAHPTHIGPEQTDAVVGRFEEDGPGEVGCAIVDCSGVSEVGLQDSGSLSFVK
jgi:hypothetical protein